MTRTATRTEASEDAREVVGRLERWGVALLLGLVGCDGRCGGSSVGTELPPPVPPSAAAEEAAPAPAADKPLKEVRVTLADVQDIPRGELRIVEAPKYETRKLGKPKVLMEGKYLRLPDTPWPLAPDRGFVLVQDGPGWDSKVLEARLLDLRTGDVLATLRTVHRETYAKLGVALGEAEVGGKLHEVLVHASDGQIVPLWPVEQGKSRFVVINAGTGDAWVFEEQKGEADAEEDPYPPYRYAYWGDLRKPPPEPKEEFAHRLEDHGSAPGGWLGPSWQDPAEAPLFLDVDSFGDDTGECAKVELRPDGYKCVPFGTWAMAAGWRGKVERDRPPVMTNVEQGERQILELGEDCVIEEVTLDPPRALIRCDDYDGRYLWSPEKAVRLPRELMLGMPSWSRDRHVLEISVERHLGVSDVEERWIDLVSLRGTHARMASSLTPSSPDGQILVEVWTQTAELHVLNLTTGRSRRIATARHPCAEFSAAAMEPPLAVYECLDGDEVVRSMSAVRVDGNEIWPLPLLRELWVSSAGQLLVGLVEEKGKTSVLCWSME